MDLCHPGHHCRSAPPPHLPKVHIITLSKGSPPPPNKQKKVFFGEIPPKGGWVGWLIPKQGPKKKQITPKIAFFDPNFTFHFPESHKNPGVGGWVNTFGKDLPKKRVFLYLPLYKRLWSCLGPKILKLSSLCTLFLKIKGKNHQNKLWACMVDS